MHRKDQANKRWKPNISSKTTSDFANKTHLVCDAYIFVLFINALRTQPTSQIHKGIPETVRAYGRSLNLGLNYVWWYTLSTAHTCTRTK